MNKLRENKEGNGYILVKTSKCEGERELMKKRKSEEAFWNKIQRL